MQPQRHSPIIYLAFFITGITGLVFQITWTRLLVLSFGYSIYSVSTVLGAFMGGLAVGSFYGGRLADRIKNPIRAYAICELFVGAIALLASFLLRELPELMASFRLALQIPYYGFSPWVLAVALVILLPPTILMGATLPLLVKGLTRSSQSGGNDIGTLYAINTLGATIGAALTGFILLALLGIGSTLWVAALCNMGIGLIIYCVSKESAQTGESKPNTQKTEIIEKHASILRNPLVWAFGLSGFISLAAEVFWTRILAPYLESSTYAFSLVLTIFLLGIFLGTWVSKKRATQGTFTPAFGFGISQILVGITTGLGLIFLMGFIKYANVMLPLLGILLQEPTLIAKSFGWYVLILLPSTFFMGFGFPYIAQWVATDLHHVGKRSGVVYSLNTLAAVCGALVSGFIMIPRLGIHQSFLILIGLSLFSGFALLNLEKQLSFKTRCFLGILFLLFLTGLWRLPEPNMLATKLAYPNDLLIAHREDADASISFLSSQDANPINMLNINLRPVSGTSLNLTAWMTHLPLLLLKDRASKKVLNIGLGIGHTFVTAIKYANTEVTVVELLPGVVDIFKEYRPSSQKILQNPRAHIIVGDGRSYLLSSKETFDVIMIDPTPPLYGAGVVNLYTKDFFEICRKKLTPDGFLMLRLPGDVNPFSLRLILKTASDVFKGLSLWQRFANSGFSVIASPSDYPIPTSEELNNKVRAIHFISEEEKDFLLHVQPISLATPEKINTLIQNVKPVTDDHPYLENPLFFNWWQKKWKLKWNSN